MMKEGMKMFSIEKLNEKIGYEKWVTKEAVLAIEKNYGTTTDATIDFKESGRKIHHVTAHVELGSEKRKEVYEKLSPLLFVTSYKIIDMIFEWLLEENLKNDKKVPGGFRQKIDSYETNKKDPSFQYPDLLTNEENLMENLFSLYKHLLDYRNQIIHGNWGKIKDGDLDFSFERNKKTYSKYVSFKKIMNFAEIASLFADLLTQKTNASVEKVDTIKYLMDTSKGVLHEGNILGNPKVRHYKINYEAFNKQFVDLTEIKDHLTTQSFHHPFSFDLIVFSKDKRWEFPWEFVENINSIDLNEKLDDYLI